MCGVNADQRMQWGSRDVTGQERGRKREGGVQTRGREQGEQPREREWEKPDDERRTTGTPRFARPPFGWALAAAGRTRRLCPASFHRLLPMILPPPRRLLMICSLPSLPLVHCCVIRFRSCSPTVVDRVYRPFCAWSRWAQEWCPQCDRSSCPHEPARGEPTALRGRGSS